MSFRREFTTSVSDRNTFNSCRFKWFISSNNKMGYRFRSEKAKPLYFGSLGHAVLEKYYSYGGKINPIGIFNELTKDYDITQIQDDEKALKNHLETMEELPYILLEYHKWARENDKQWFDKVLFVERKFKSKMKNHLKQPLKHLKGDKKGYLMRTLQNGEKEYIYQKGFFDALVQDDLGFYWILEHKFYKKDTDLSKLETDPQSVSYIIAAEELFDLEISGVIYNIISKVDKPQKPKILKSGKMSTALKANTTYDLAIKTIKENDLNEEDYKDYLDLLLNQPKKEIVQRVKVYKSDMEKAMQYRFNLNSIDESCDPNLSIYPNRLSYWICDNCQYKIPCDLILQGKDWKTYVKNNYEPPQEH